MTLPEGRLYELSRRRRRRALLLRHRRRIYCNRSHWRDKAIAAAGNGFDEARFRDGIVENLANLVDGGAQAVIEVHKRVGGPKLLAYLLACYQLARTIEEHDQQLEGLGLQPDSFAILCQLPRMQVCFVSAESKSTRSGYRDRHKDQSRSE